MGATPARQPVRESGSLTVSVLLSNQIKRVALNVRPFMTVLVIMAQCLAVLAAMPVLALLFTLQRYKSKPDGMPLAEKKSAISNKKNLTSPDNS